MSTALAESAVNSVVNQRINKRRQTGLPEAGARSPLRVRTAVINADPERLEPARTPTVANEPIALALAA